MDYKREIISAINRFYLESIEEFREAEARIAMDSKFRKMFQKKNYGRNINLLRKCKQKANDIVFPDDIPEDDTDSRDILHRCRECIRSFGRLCDSYIAMQVMLDSKAQGEKVSYREYNEIYKQSRARHAEMNEKIRELDILYADYTDEGYGADDGYLTYDMIVGGNEKE